MGLSNLFGIFSLFGNVEDFASKDSILVLGFDFFCSEIHSAIYPQQYAKIGVREQNFFQGKEFFYFDFNKRCDIFVGAKSLLGVSLL